MIQTIRAATLTDHRKMEQLWEASVRATHHFLTEQDIADIRVQLSMIFNSISCYVSVNKDGAITGILGLTGDQIAMLFVAPNAFGKGVGRQLMNFAINQHGLRKVEVNEQNPQAVGFYQHLGFEITDRRALDDDGRPFPILEMQLKR